MGHTLEKRWEDIGTEVSNLSRQMLAILIEGEEQYQRMVEVYTYAGGTDQGLADLLFKDRWSIRDSNDDGTLDTQANADEVTMAGDARLAMVAMHELYLAVTGGTVAAEDRATPMRRMA
jgi:hypothetical protein